MFAVDGSQEVVVFPEQQASRGDLLFGAAGALARPTKPIGLAVATTRTAACLAPLVQATELPGLT